ncbi:hypothetical protein [Streptomyces sp. NBRC 14336]|uniref:hypothetical protein n=1 Tax=Streptomyces sp. NBRC 14336 TaxID=3030992 RepID=UPI002556DFFB|nr:hypothetical protein [Streptomyces sp. NBRC 14336]
MNNWREDAQPEWPEAAPGTQPTQLGGGGTQAFPNTSGYRPEPAGGDETAVLPKAVPGAGGPDAAGGEDLTELLSAFDRFDRTEVLPSAGRRGEAPRHASASDAFTPRGAGNGPAPADPFPPVAETRESPAAIRDPWDTADDAVTHDPHEVTIQLDSVNLQLDGSLRGAKAGPSGSEASDGPVFVDESGRRSRRFRRIGMAVALACAVYAVVIVVTVMSGNSNAPWLPVQEPKKDTPAGKVDTSPLPAESASTDGPDGASPGASPSASDGVTPSAGATAAVPGATATGEAPDATTDPEPTATKKPTTGTGAGGTTSRPDPTNTATVPDPGPTATETGEPTPPEETETSGGGEAGGGTGADSVAVGQAQNLTADSHDPYPEHTL